MSKIKESKIPQKAIFSANKTPTQNATPDALKTLRNTPIGFFAYFIVNLIHYDHLFIFLCLLIEKNLNFIIYNFFDPCRCANDIK